MSKPQLPIGNSGASSKSSSLVERLLVLRLFDLDAIIHEAALHLLILVPIHGSKALLWFFRLLVHIQNGCLELHKCLIVHLKLIAWPPSLFTWALVGLCCHLLPDLL